MSATNGNSDRFASNAAVSSKAAGESAESAVIEIVDELEYVPDYELEHVDARATTAIEPSAELPTVSLPVVAIGTLAEIKSAMVSYGRDSRRGRFYLRQKQHEHLLENGAVYVFAVCRPTPDRDVIALKVVPATVVDELVPSWIDGDDRPDYAQLSWSRVFDPSEVQR